jgi:hypothetical protein
MVAGIGFLTVEKAAAPFGAAGSSTRIHSNGGK